MSIGLVETQFCTIDGPITLAKGGTLGPVTIAYETYGELNDERDNAILVFHALTASQHVAGKNPAVAGVDCWTDECMEGWWSRFVGPGLAIDTDKFFVICANYLGGCYGSTGPSSINPETGKPYGSTFPRVTLADIVDSNVRLVRDHLGIEQLHAVAGASVGGMMAMSLSTRYPDLVRIVIPIASGLSPTALHTIYNFEQIAAIENDPNWNGGDYYDGPSPNAGLALARIIGHKSFVSLEAMEERARQEELGSDEGPPNYGIHNPLESYMWHQGTKFVDRFDANTYHLLMEVWSGADLFGDAGAEDVVELFTPCKHQRYMVFTIDSDVCFYPEEQTELALSLKAAHVRHRRITVHSDKGHDAFLVEPWLFTPHLRDSLENPWDDLASELGSR